MCIPVVWPTIHPHPIACAKLLNGWKRSSRLIERHPNHVVLLDAMVCCNLCFGWNLCRVIQLRNVCAFSSFVKLPTVIWAHDGVALYASAAERSPSVNANVTSCMGGSSTVAPNNQWFAKQPHRQRRGSKFGRKCNWMKCGTHFYERSNSIRNSLAN